MQLSVTETVHKGQRGTGGDSELVGIFCKPTAVLKINAIGFIRRRGRGKKKKEEEEESASVDSGARLPRFEPRLSGHHVSACCSAMTCSLCRGDSALHEWDGSP